MVEFKLPDVGEGMHEAEIVRWLVKPGQSVRLDEPMLEIQTDKALVEIPAPVAGQVIELKVSEGKMAHVGDVLIVLEQAGVKPAAPVPASTTSPTPASPASSLPKTEVSIPSNGANSDGAGGLQRPVRAAPAVRKFALESGVDLRMVAASSPDGRILLDDVKAFLEGKNRNGAGSNGAQTAALETSPLVAVRDAPAPVAEVAKPTPAANLPEKIRQPIFTQGGPEEERKPLVGLRRRIAERMELAWRTIPHVTTFDEADAGELMTLREKLKPAAEKQGLHLTYLPLIVKIVVAALKEFPIFNASLDEQSREIVYKRNYHIGMATSTPDGLLVPVLRNAAQKSLLELTAEIARLSEGARKRSLGVTELSGSTFTITNFGSYGSAVGTPIINPPEVAILGVGRVQDKIVPRNGQAVVRPILPFCLSFDHRVIDGADSGAFMNRIKELLENPALLLL